MRAEMALKAGNYLFYSYCCDGNAATLNLNIHFRADAPQTSYGTFNFLRIYWSFNNLLLALLLPIVDLFIAVDYVWDFFRVYSRALF